MSDPEVSPSRQDPITIGVEDARTPDALWLVEATRMELGRRYGTNASAFHPEEVSPPHGRFVVAWVGGVALGCGAFRRFDEHAVEIKQMYVAPAGRRRGLARLILKELERLAAVAGYRVARLETGTLQIEAIALYETSGYSRIPPFGCYIGNPISVCFEKMLPMPS